MLAKRRFTTIVPMPNEILTKGQQQPRPHSFAESGGLHTCKFCHNVIRSGEDVLSPCRCQGISKLVHRECLVTCILSLKSQRCLQAKCGTCEIDYQYSISKERRCHCCIITDCSKRLYCCLVTLILILTWVAALFYCFAEQSMKYFVYFGVFALVWIFANVLICFKALCMEDVNRVYVEDYCEKAPGGGNGRAKTLQDVCCEEPCADIELGEIDVENPEEKADEEK